MKSPYRLKQLLFFLALTIVVAIITSCNKEKDTIAVITVKNTNGNFVEGATVRLFGDPSDSSGFGRKVRIDEEKSTDDEGEASFNFTELYEKGQSGFTILNIEASRDTLEGDGFIRVEPEEENTKTVIIE